jgi:hypothetical protein
MNRHWVIAKTGRAHVDLGERSSQSLRVRAEHVIVTLCRAHVDADAPIAPDGYKPRCSNCVRISLSVDMEADEPLPMAETRAA